MDQSVPWRCLTNRSGRNSIKKWTRGPAGPGFRSHDEDGSLWVGKWWVEAEEDKR